MVDLRAEANKRKRDFEAKVRAIAAEVEQKAVVKEEMKKALLVPMPPFFVYQHPWKKILEEIAEKHGVPKRILLSTDKSVAAVRARWELFYRMNTECHLSLAEIGRRVGKDHSTVLYGVRKYKQEMERASQEDTARQPLLDRPAR